jgi:hypothetical protein
MDLIEKYLGEDVRGKVKIGKVTLDTNNDFQRQILNQQEPNTSYHDKKTGQTYYGGSGLKNPLTEPEIEKIYKMSKKYWKNGGTYIDHNGEKVFIALNYNHLPNDKGFYGSYSYDGWVGSSALKKTPDQAIKATVALFKKKFK